MQMTYVGCPAVTRLCFPHTAVAARGARRDVPRLERLGRNRCLGRRAAMGDESLVETSQESVSRVEEWKERMQSWSWKEKKINFLVAGKGPPLLLVHGFGASILHFRSNIPVLAQSYTVYALDLLGFGQSEKAPVKYSMELWRDLIIDFTNEWIKEPFLIVGNSIGSLASIMATVEIQERIVGIALLNCAGAMNNKGLKDDWRIKAALPLFYLIDVLLRIRPVAQYFFNRLATDETVRVLLTNVYCNKQAVDDELVEIFLDPSKDVGALDVFVSILTGPGGPRPQDVLSQIECPVLVLWGEKDLLTPFDNPVSDFLKTWPNATFIPLTDTGHALHDDRPEEVHRHLLPWLAQIHTSHTDSDAS